MTEEETQLLNVSFKLFSSFMIRFYFLFLIIKVLISFMFIPLLSDEDTFGITLIFVLLPASYVAILITFKMVKEKSYKDKKENTISRLILKNYSDKITEDSIWQKIAFSYWWRFVLSSNMLEFIISYLPIAPQYGNLVVVFLSIYISWFWYFGWYGKESIPLEFSVKKNESN